MYLDQSSLTLRSYTLGSKYPKQVVRFPIKEIKRCWHLEYFECILQNYFVLTISLL